MGNRLLWVIAGTALLAAGCSSTFMVVKNGSGYMLGSDSNEVYRLLCESGDLQKILLDAHVGDNRIEDDSDNGVLGVGYRWAHRGIEYPFPGRKDTFS